MSTIKIKSSNLYELARQLEREAAMAVSYANFYYRQEVITIFDKIVKQTPQFGGDLVNNWYIGIGGADAQYDARDGGKLWKSFSPDSSQPFKMGDTENTGEPMARARRLAYAMKYLGEPVHIFNNTPYAEDIDMGKGPVDDHGTQYPIRPVNLIDGVVQMLAHNVAWASSTGKWRL